MSDFNGAISALYIYPIKSCAATPCERVELTAHGLKHDRQWMIVDQHGQFQTQRQIPHLVWITPTVDKNAITLSAPGQSDLSFPILGPEQAASHPSKAVTVWKDSLPAIDLGPQASQWLDGFLEVPGKSYHLVQFDPNATRVSDPKWASEGPAGVHFADGFAVNVLSQAAVDLFNDKALEMGLGTVDPLRFRPNIVLNGLEAHAEDLSDRLLFGLAQDQIELALVKPCPRCQIPDIDPNTSIKEPLISKILATYRQLSSMDHAVCFGMNAVVRSGAGHDLYINQPLRGFYNI